MKTKTLFFLFNIVLIAAVMLCFFSLFQIFPLSSVNGLKDHPAGFWISISACIFVLAALACADIFFIRHSRMIDFLMEENWQALALLLEQSIIEKGRFSRHGTALFISVLVLLSDCKTMRRLFSKLKSERPALCRLFAPDFIAAAIVFGEIGEAESCIAAALEEARLLKPRERDWVKFYKAFISFRKGEYQPVSEEFAGLVFSAVEPVVCAVSGYFCTRLIPARTFGVGVSESALLAASGAARKKILESFTIKRWQEHCAKRRKKVRAAAIGKTIDLSSEWIFGEESLSAKAKKKQGSLE